MTDTVAKRSEASQAMLDASAKGRALMGGTDAMRAAGERFLPKFEAESVEAYRSRLRASWLFNGYRKTARDMTGRVFEKPIEAAEVPSIIEDMLENVDLQGRDLSIWARDVFEDGLSGCGISWIMVDAPPREGTVTRAQAAQGNLRPFLVHLKIEDVLGWRVETVDNAPKLTMLRLFEQVVERDPADEFSDVAIDQVRVLDITDRGPVRTRIYRNVGGSLGEKWQQTGGETYSDMTEITVIPFYANRTGFWKAEPLLDDLADINIAHWQSQSDQRNILHFARVPILVRTGVDSETSPLAIGAATSMDISSPDADVKWVEHTGAAIDAGRQDLKDLEFQMETHGLQLLVARPGAQSATGEALDAAKETSQLSAIADGLQDALEQALTWMAAYAGDGEAEVSLTVNKDFGVTMMTAQEVSVMLQAVQTGNLSRETFIGEMVRRGMLRSDLDPEEEAERISADPPALTGDPMPLDDEEEDNGAA
ncbi:DUF4055 domain-containing protein [Roseibacterium sp. SDUM158017]|uniref:DUF4055 domain-containing protein n=1 Tax=Roseicyclus salinarum TaxID=3036773 RepID=UPI0024157CE4|nr:DUF4055 domain-containing protein [Roseibacterium sp. SDUM158017]MDG4650104.1 DUF4055 domain-containing protein [Roseibacterium sp. SDUM158017]